MKPATIILALAIAPAAHAQGGGSAQFPNPLVLVIVLGALALAPFVLIMLTSFVKISVVLSILRNALGTQQVPPNAVITGLAFVLSMFVMVPVAEQMYEAAGSIPNTRDIFSEASVKSIFDAAQRGKEPLRQFLGRHAHVKDRELFMDLANRIEVASRRPVSEPAAQSPVLARQAPAPGIVLVAQAAPPQAPAANPQQARPPAPPPSVPRVDKNDFQVLIPSFVTSQLKEAFQIGFLIFVPFIIIDMVVANVLLAMGMHMLSPSVVSLPFKILLFVLVDGWFLIVRGLVVSYL
jgi:type III secretion protein R